MFERGAIPLIIVLFLLAVNVNAYEYIIPYYDNSVTGATINTDPVSFYVENTEDITLYQRLGFIFNTSTSSTYNADYESPFDLIYAVASGTLTSNKTCFNVGEADKNAVSNSFEARNNLVHDGDSAATFISTQNKYVIDTTNEYVNISVYNNTDSEDYVYNVYSVYENSAIQVNRDDIISRFNADNFGFCDTLSVARTKHNVTVGAVVNIAYFYMIFNSTSGNIEWDVRAVGLENTRTSMGLIYKFSDNTVVEWHNQTGAITWSDSNSNLEEDTLYVLALGLEIFLAKTSYIVPDMSVLIDIRQADYVCGDWTDCDDEGYQYQDCVDINEVDVDKIESRACSLVILENATLGFEEYYNDFALKCVPDWLGAYQIQNITRDTPLGWSVSEDFTDEGMQRDFLRMTSEWSTEGSRSLKMWYIPPKNGEPITNTTCGNITYGLTPSVHQDVSNTTFLVSYNVTFPAENMMLSFDVKGCPEQVLQHDLLYTLWIIPVAPKVCYASDCNTTPDSAYQFFIRNSAGEILTNHYDNYVNPYRKDTPEIDLTGLGIVAGENYTLSFQAMPENLNSQAGNCIMFDKVRYSVLENPYIDIIGGDCSIGSVCLGTTLYITHEYEGGRCVVVKTEDACGLPDEILDKIENLENYCDLEDSNILNSYDYDIQDWRDTTCEYGCEDDRCLTLEDIEDAEVSATLYDCVLGQYCGGLGAFGVFLSIFMIVNYIAILFGIAVLTITKGENPLYAGIVTIMIILGAFAGGIYPVEIGLTIIALIVLAVSLYFGKQLVGGG